MPRLYVPLPLIAGDHLDLPEDAAHHWVRVLRARTGERVQIFDGQGHEAEAELVEVSKRGAQVLIHRVSRPLVEPLLQTHLGQVMSRGERMDYALQKATELGVSEITPLVSERCELRLRGDDRADKKQSHWLRIIISACEQSGRTRVPILHAPMTVSDWQASVQADQRWVLAPVATPVAATISVAPTTTTTTTTTTTVIAAAMTSVNQPIALSGDSKPRTIALLIGPEGGLTEAEVMAAEHLGFKSWQLGPRILRTETAPVAALTLLQWLYGDLAS